jgi:hypothetical protein
MSADTAVLSGATDVFALSERGGCAVMFTCRRRTGLRPSTVTVAVEGVRAELDALAEQGWSTSVGAMFGRPDQASAYDTAFSSDVDFAGAFEAPGPAAALEGTVRLGAAGWDTLARTEWIVGPREFDPVPAPASSDPDALPWGFLALWTWNAAWQAASPEQRREYDAECDVAFSADVAAGVGIAGRHRLDWASRWHHLGIWESPSFDVVSAAMLEHERVADFKFTTSRHYLGRRTPLLDLIGASND